MGAESKDSMDLELGSRIRSWTHSRI